MTTSVVTVPKKYGSQLLATKKLPDIFKIVLTDCILMHVCGLVFNVDEGGNYKYLFVIYVRKI